MAKSTKSRPVLVTTEYRGVFFGFAADTSTDTIKLEKARNCIYWAGDVGGFLGLASSGPTKSCRIGAVADVELRKITSVTEMSPAAVAAWEAAPCYKG